MLTRTIKLTIVIYDILFHFIHHLGHCAVSQRKMITKRELGELREMRHTAHYLDR